ncbi:MAG: MFS transporter [Nocardioidaceae bacterium]
MRLPEPFTPLRDPPFAWYLSGRLISTMGTVMAPVALTFAVLDIDNSPSSLGVVLAARSIPLVLFLLVGGVVADRLSRSLVMQVSHLASGLTQGLVAVLLLSGHAELWMIVVLEALNGTASAFTFPAMQGVVPLVVPRSHIQQANAMLGFTRSGLAVLGPTIGALIVVTVGSGWAIAVDAATFTVAAFCMSRLRLPKAALGDGASASMVRELKEGWTSFTSMTWVWVVVVSFGISNAIYAGAFLTLGPAIAKDTIGVDGWGYLLSSEAVGLLLMTLVLMKVRLRFPIRAGMLGVTMLAGPMLLLGAHPTLLPLLALGFLAGCGVEVFSIGWQTALHENIPNDVLARVSSYDALGSFVAIPVGQLAFGPLARVFDEGSLVVTSSLVFAVVCLVTLVSSSVRNLQRAPADPALQPASTPVPSA